MGVTQMTSPLEAGDGRLKVLWLDDTIDRIAPWAGAASDFEPWFSLVYATHPSDVRELVDRAGERCAPSGAASPLYDLKGPPFDAYLVDFRLCDKIDDGCALDSHLDEGLHAPSAGLLVGILTALRWPKHAQALVPYSGYDEEFGQIWRLTQQFCPPVVCVLWDDSVTKGTRDQESLLKLLPRQCRRALKRALEEAEAVMPLRERDRWEMLLEEGPDEGAGGATDDPPGEATRKTVPADEKIWLNTDCGVRPFLVGALFHDSLDEESRIVPASAVRSWIGDLPVADPLEREARRLAEFYWQLSRTEASRTVYSIARAMKMGREIPDLPEKPPSYPWLCSWKEKGGGRDMSVERIRLSILFLILREHEYRVRQRAKQTDIPDEVRRLMQAIRDDEGSVEQLLQDLEHAAWLDGSVERYHDLIEQFLEVLQDRTWIDPIRELAEDWDLDVSEADVARLLDPFPASWDVPFSLDESTKVGKGVTRLDFGDAPSLDVKEILQGDVSSLTPTEFFCAKRFGRELLPSEEDWPGWLRAGGGSPQD